MRNFVKRETGSSLIYVILFIGLMLVITFTVSALAIRELQTTSVSQNSLEAYYVAEAGIEKGLYELAKGDPDGNLPVEGVLVGDGEYLARINENATLGSLSGESITFTLGEFETRELFLYNEDDLLDNIFDTNGNVKITIECTSPRGEGCKQTSSALSVTTMHFDGRFAGQSFDLDQLLGSDDPRLIESVDESDISITKEFSENGNVEITLSNVRDNRYIIQIKPLIDGGPFTVMALGGETPFTEGVVALESFGDVNGDTRRAIQVLFDTTRTPLDIFDYVLLEEDDIEKCAELDSNCP